MKPYTHQIRVLISSLFILLILFNTKAQVVTWNNQVFRIDTLTAQLGFPWEISYGPDDSLWVTEARMYRITKVHARNGGKRILLDLNNLINFNRSIAQWPQGGLMGMALHPQLLGGKPYVYVALVYFKYPTSGSPNNNLCSGTTGNHPCFFKTKILRYTYNAASGTLNSSPDIVLDDLSGSNDHNSGRLTIGPDNLLYYTIGDMGAGQFNNQTRTNNAQDINVYEGKILRLNTEPDAAQSGGAEWIPDTNPFPTSGPVTSKTPVFSYGHRNPQGIQWGNVAGTWRLYSSEHGDKSDDEVNIINAGINYGWPKVAGLCDDNYNTADGNSNNNVLANQTVPNEIATFCNGTPNQEPMFSLFNAAAASIPSSGANIFTWPTVAPSGIDFYGTYSNTIPGWSNSLLVTSLKYGLFRLKIKSPLGDRVDSTSTSSITDTIPYFHGNRIRDVAINPHGDTLYFAIDSSGSTSGPTGGFSGSSTATPNAGRILRVVYISTLALREYIPLKPVYNRTFVKLYPNPASKILYVQSKRGMHKPLRVELWDISGKLMLQATTGKDNFSINVENFGRGMYILKLYNGFGVLMTTEKVIIQ
ncbi:MAG: PQQ-dependent sugar dehydrogenase [Chitinophagaceae bacterium]